MANSPASPLLARLQGEDDSLHSGIKHALRSFAMNLDDMLPAIVLSYDRVNNVANILPLIQWVDTQNESITRPGAMSIPVLSLGGGGFHINFPLKKNDLGWIKANDRDLSLFLASLSLSIPPTSRHNSFADAMFIPDVYRNYTINSADSGSLVIQTTSSSTRIAIDPNGNINITAPTSLNVTTPTANFSADVNIAGNLKVTKNTTVTGNTAVNGGLDATGSGSAEVTLPANATIGGITVATHGHISSSPGSRTSGNMIA